METPNYYGILPAKIRYDKSLKPMEKIMYTEITALSNSKGYCHAKNSYFAELYEVHKNTVGIWINNLAKKGYISIKLIYKKNSKEIEERRVFIDGNPINVNVATYQPKDCGGYQQKDCYPINENVEDNITSNNNINNNNTHKEKIPKTCNNSKDENTPQLIKQILNKYEALRLPAYSHAPSNYVIMEVYNILGAKELFKALENMSKSEFVKNNLSINSIFKLDNLKKSLNGSFKEKIKSDKVKTKEFVETKYSDAGTEELLKKWGL
ncbi:MAG: helix-turn-helix domain-containing protein [Fusobacteriaceae bacterium]